MNRSKKKKKASDYVKGQLLRGKSPFHDVSSPKEALLSLNCFYPSKLMGFQGEEEKEGFPPFFSLSLQNSLPTTYKTILLGV